jgi:hypothetical protein
MLVNKFSVFAKAAHNEKIQKFIVFSQKQTNGFLSKF